MLRNSNKKLLYVFNKFKPVSIHQQILRTLRIIKKLKKSFL